MVSDEVQDMVNAYHLPGRTAERTAFQCQHQPSLEALQREKIELEIECLKLKSDYLTKKINKLEE